MQGYRSTVTGDSWNVHLPAVLIRSVQPTRNCAYWHRYCYSTGVLYMLSCLKVDTAARAIPLKDHVEARMILSSFVLRNVSLA